MPGMQEQVNNNIANLPQGGYMQTQNGTFGNGYLSTGELDPNKGKGSWEDYVRQLGFSNLENITDFNSPLYQQYAQYLQKTMPGIGANTLLAPLMAGGVGYAGGQAIAQQRLASMSGQRQDKINTGVQQFAGGLQSQVMPQLGQIGNSFANTISRASQENQFNQQNSGWGMLGNVVGSVAGLLNPFGGGDGQNQQNQQPVGGYGRF